MFGNISGNKSNIYETDWFKFDRENVILDFFSFFFFFFDNSTKMYLDKINMLLDTYPRLKEVINKSSNLNLNLG